MSTPVRLVLGCALLLAAAVLLTVAVLGARGRLRRNPWAGVRTRRTLESDEAFALLRRASQHLNRKLRDVAAEVERTGELPLRTAPRLAENDVQDGTGTA